MRSCIRGAVFLWMLGGAIMLLSLPSMTSAQASGSGKPWMNQSLSASERAALLIRAMTLDEKISMLHGVDPIPVKAYVGYVPSNERLGIPALRLTDGRAGIGNGAHDVTLLPAPIAAASSWDTELMNEFGKVLGQEQRGKGSNVALAPSIDVVRVPEWGRTFESYGEDPRFNGEMAVAEIRGIQSEGPIADANMYVTMNQESNRFKEDSIVDERTLHEIYLPPFEAAIQRGGVGTVMCAYVKTNGMYSCENSELLNDILRTQLHFDGWIMSDWGATHSTIAAVKNGLDQEMPGDKYYGKSLKDAVASGEIATEIIDRHVRAILVPMFRQGLFDKDQPGNWKSNVRSPEHDAFSRRVAEQGTILLKNDAGILPLGGKESIVVIGAAGGKTPKAEGGGSSGVVAPYVITPLEGIRRRAGAGSNLSYDDGHDPAKAVEAARAANIAIVFVHTDETEGSDRPDLALPGNQDQLIAAVAAANSKTIVVLDTGGPVLMPWLSKVTGLIEAWYPGQEDGNAIAAVLYGDVNPSAKLPLTFPRTASAIPTASQQQWPGVDGQSTYSEKLNVGYRWYDATRTEPLFPFGFGLSYTTFQLSHLELTRSESGNAGSSQERVQVKVEVRNTGKRGGAEVVQVYIEHPSANGEPPHQLAAFAKVGLGAGEAKPVSLSVDERAFSVYSASQHRWVMPDGAYEILAGSSSRDLPLHQSLSVHDSRIIIGK